MTDQKMNPMSDGRVRDGKYHVVYFPSGYVGTPYRAHVCRWATEYKNNWRDYANDSVGEYGEVTPVGWHDLPEPSSETLHGDLEKALQVGFEFKGDRSSDLVCTQDELFEFARKIREEKAP